jgi:hypothetical protein
VEHGAAQQRFNAGPTTRGVGMRSRGLAGDYCCGAAAKSTGGSAKLKQGSSGEKGTGLSDSGWGRVNGSGQAR